MRLSRLLTGGLLLAALGGPALAQGDAPAQMGRPDVKTIEDWMVRCFPVANPSPCDMFQERIAQQTQQRVLTFSMAFVPSRNSNILQITVPLDVSIPKGLVIQTGSYTSPVMKYRMCTREGCFVQTVADNAMVEQLARASGTANINVVGDNGKKASLTLSLKGFAAARDDMMAQARAKAKTPDPAAAAPAQ